MKTIRNIIFISVILFLLTLFSPVKNSEAAENNLTGEVKYSYEEIIGVLEEADLTEEQILEIESLLETNNVQTAFNDFIRILNKLKESGSDETQNLIKKYLEKP